MSLGIVLVHGYTGSPKDLTYLVQQLIKKYHDASVTNICLAGHGSKDIPPFDEQKFTAQISGVINTYRREKREIIILGHSTGGVLALSSLLEHAYVPSLLILAALPKKIGIAYLDRWNKHRVGKKDIPFSFLAKMISLINTVGSKRFKGTFPVLIVQGESDNLVSPQESLAWGQNNFNGPTRTVIIPSAGHNIFKGTNNAVAIDIVVRAIADVINNPQKENKKSMDILAKVEPEAKKFLAVSPLSARHLAQCPSGQALVDTKPLLSPVVNYEPVFANIEITTRCNLHCQYCVRTRLNKQSADMSKESFSRILKLLPHAYRITLVGLGEPLLHPQIVDFITEASAQGRRVALVTNGMCLDKKISYELLKAGLHSIAFSIDGPNKTIASEVRRGTDFKKVINNIKTFIRISSEMKTISTAVFSAVSAKTVPYLEELVDLVSDLGVHVLMLTDLNFKENIADTLWKNENNHTKTIIQKAIVYAFSKKLPVLTVRGLEEFGLSARYEKFLLLSPSQLHQRSSKRNWCFSPWQTMPIDVCGNVTLCDCQPKRIVGNLYTQSLSEIWNSKTLVKYRKNMLSLNPPEPCRICPRF